MRFNGLDLNLLVTLNMLLEERNVSRTAARLNVTQPAISAALARLRDFFEDDLFVPQGKRILPTALAELLRPQIGEVLGSIGAILDSSRSFDPATSRRTFRIAASDYMTMVLIQPLTQRLVTIAPGVELVIELTSDRTQSRLEEGKIDMEILPEEYASPRHPAEAVFDERHVVVGWSGNPALDRPIDERTFAMLEHVAVLVGSDAPAAFADRQLQRLGRSRRIAVTVPNFSAVPWMVIGTGRIGLMHERLAIMMQAYLPLSISPLPFEFPMMRELVQYHRSRANDVGLGWLRQQMTR